MEMQLAQIELNSVFKKREKIAPGFFVTEKDIEIMDFLLEMKFATLEDLHFKFFRNLRNGKISESFWWAKERLDVLVKNNFLKREHCFFRRRIYFFATMKAFTYVSKIAFCKNPLRPTDRIDLKYFDHDSAVLNLRLLLEANGVAKNWKSDKRLHTKNAEDFQFELSNTPDAIFERSDGQRVALELEIATKSKARYQQKIQSYVHLMRRQEAPFKKVLYVCMKENVFKLISKEALVYSDLFQIEHGLNFLNNQSTSI